MFNVPALTFRQLKNNILQSSDNFKKISNRLIFTELLKDSELKYLTGFNRQQFLNHLQTLSPQLQREIQLDDSARLLVYLEKMRHATTNDSAAIHRGVSEWTIRKIFWDYAVHQFRNDRTIKFRNVNLGPQPDHEAVLMPHEVMDPYWLEFYLPLIGPNGRLILMSFDHTYIQQYKSMSPSLQMRIFCPYKYDHVIKYGLLVSHNGKAVYVTPSSTSTTPDSGDGNLISLQLEMEHAGQIIGQLGYLLCPNINNVYVISHFDAGKLNILFMNYSLITLC